ncbi:hypothetical protein Acr_19g0005490 [Actinidia rufa]|uniref:Plant bHLH transcription factor ACT-like domain-containing protein n=1 Tax=Actinidia rufa TaxID=165716 RepID=A0A7J0GA48_9ERIC|nr:hypothetical protein Acr_19g0005490 [Actinidia rufa]
MEPVEQFDEALGDSMTPQSEKTPREGERGDDSQEPSSPSSAVFRHQTCEEAATVKLDAIAEGKNVLIRIECVNQKGYITKIVTEIEKLHLTIGSFNSLPFGNNLLAITISAQMDDEFYMTTTDLLTNLRRCMCEK